MKAAVNHTQKLLVIVLLVIYVFTVSTYIIFLQSRTADSAAFIKTTTIAHLASHNAAGNFYNKQHGAFKTTSPNKRKVVSAIYSLVCVAVLFLMPALQLFPLSRLTAIVTGLMYAGQPGYLSLRVLRI